jgi:hypothetical protein
MKNIVDLHGVKHQDVKPILDGKIWECFQQDWTRLYVITGHSPEMKKIITDIAIEYNATAVESLFNPAEMIIDF